MSSHNDSPTRRTVALLLWMALLAITPAALADEPPATQPAEHAARKLPVVKSYEQLLATEPIALAGDQKVWLGIEDTDVVSPGGVLIYALASKPAQRNEVQDMGLSGGPLGPVNVRLTPLNSELSSIVARSVKVNSRLASSGRPLYVYRLPMVIDSKGWEVRIESEDGRLLAERKVRRVVASDSGGDAPAHSWTPLQTPHQGESAKQSGDDPVYSFTPMLDVVALPGTEPLDGLRPVACVFMKDDGEIQVAAVQSQNLRVPKSSDDEDQANNATPLPTYFPQKPATDLTLKREDGDFVLVSKHRYIDEPFRERLLVRFWVDGEPFVASTAKHDQALIVSEYLPHQHLQKLPQTIRFRLNEFNPADIGTKPGSKITMQLLFSPSGWRRAQGQKALAQMRRPERERSPLPCITNPVSWTAEASK